MILKKINYVGWQLGWAGAFRTRPDRGSEVAQLLTHLPLVLEVRGLKAAHDEKKFPCLNARSSLVSLIRSG